MVIAMSRGIGRDTHTVWLIEVHVLGVRVVDEGVDPVQELVRLVLCFYHATVDVRFLIE